MELVEIKQVLSKMKNNIEVHPDIGITDEMVAKYNYIYFELLDNPKHNYDLGFRIVSRSDFLHHRTINNNPIAHHHDENGGHSALTEQDAHLELKEGDVTNFSKVTSLNKDYYIKNDSNEFYDLSYYNFLNIVASALLYVESRIDEEERLAENKPESKGIKR